MYHQCFRKTIGDDISQNCLCQVGRWRILPGGEGHAATGWFPRGSKCDVAGQQVEKGAIRRSGWTWGRSQNFPMGRELFLWVGSVFRQSWKWNMTILKTKLIFQGPDTTTWHHKLYFHTSTNSYCLTTITNCKGHATSAFEAWRRPHV